MLIFLRDVVRITCFFFIFEGCSEDYIYFFFLFSILDTFILVHGSCDHF